MHILKRRNGVNNKAQVGGVEFITPITIHLSSAKEKADVPT